MTITCTIEEADRCGICDDDDTGPHAVFCRDGRVVFMLCMDCLGRAVVERARQVWPARASELRKEALKRQKELVPITAKEVMVLFDRHPKAGKGVRVDTFSRAVARFVAKRWGAAVANGVHMALESSLTREIEREAKLANLLTAIERYGTGSGDDVPCPEDHEPEECLECDLRRAVAAARNA